MPPLEMIEVALALSLHCVVACSSRQESKIQEHVCDTLSTSQCILQPLLVFMLYFSLAFCGRDDNGQRGGLKTSRS